MVCNKNKILDEGENKIFAEGIMPRPNYYFEFMNTLHTLRKLHYNVEILEKNPSPEEFSRDDVVLYREWLKDEHLRLMLNDTQIDYPVNSTVITKYMCVEPFQTSVMFNVSPNWKGKFNVKSAIGKKLTEKFKQTLITYLNSCNRYTKWKFCIECGGDGNFLHAHCVAQINPKLRKSVETHLNKGNHSREIMKAWDNQFKSHPEYLSGKEKGAVGLLKGKYAIQRIIIRDRDMLNDKLSYLVEENKPEGHRNAFDLGVLVGDY